MALDHNWDRLPRVDPEVHPDERPQPPVDDENPLPEERRPPVPRATVERLFDRLCTIAEDLDRGRELAELAKRGIDPHSGEPMDNLLRYASATGLLQGAGESAARDLRALVEGFRPVHMVSGPSPSGRVHVVRRGSANRKPTGGCGRVG